MVLRNAIPTWLLISSIVASLPISAMCAEAPKSKFIMITAVTTADADASGSEVSVVASDDSFARVHVTPNTSVSQNGAAVAFSKIKRGYKITCKGNWDTKSSNVFKAAYVFIGVTVTESDVTDRVAAACRKIANKGMARNGTGTETARISKEQPQLEISHCEYYQCEYESWVEVTVENLTERPMTQLTATVHFLTKDGKYIVSSTPHYSKQLQGSKSLPSGVKVSFLIVTPWAKNEYPELPSKCTVEFSCVNQGDLRTSPAEVKIDAKPYGR